MLTLDFVHSAALCYVRALSGEEQAKFSDEGTTASLNLAQVWMGGVRFRTRLHPSNTSH
ncbi:hypothetical protein BN8_01675 [Fibrisoma limi BUZ 3]|uniref:Uncharacterized protein n=1 Tax=Fibrisoma limi BUZ 3 TaxID=1185876 RepID=I2GFI5_9BACT|nr:hypothetical protein [Fibrisoma limi]CCH52660.1 hypothetical protein BN8_01675 [Fibrisoma limi BUZ 3]